MPQHGVRRCHVKHDHVLCQLPRASSALKVHEQRQLFEMRQDGVDIMCPPVAVCACVSCDQSTDTCVHEVHVCVEAAPSKHTSHRVSYLPESHIMACRSLHAEEARAVSTSKSGRAPCRNGA